MSRKRLEGFTSFERYEKALSRLLSLVGVRIGKEAVPVIEAVGRIAAESITSPKDYPSVDRAAVDGYAVRSLDVSGASPSNPIPLKLIGIVEVGEVPQFTVNPGEAVIVFTGAVMPKGSDAVMPFEESLRSGKYVYALRSLYQYRNVSRAGEDLRSGDLIVRRGSVIRPWHIAALTEVGITRIEVFSKPRVGVINVGSELLRSDDVLRTDYHIPNSTGPLIYAYLKELGCEPVLRGIVPDDEEEIINAVEKALEGDDIIITTGGTSVGGRDLVPEAIAKIPGAELVFHGVNLRPGRTAGAYVVAGRPIFMFSGLPVATLVSLEAFVRPLFKHLTGVESLPESTIRARVRRRISNVAGFKSFFRVVVYYENGELQLEPLRLTGSGIISTLLKGNAILVVDENVEGYDEGEYVNVILIGPIYNERPTFLESLMPSKEE